MLQHDSLRCWVEHNRMRHNARGDTRDIFRWRFREKWGVLPKTCQAGWAGLAGVNLARG